MCVIIIIFYFFIRVLFLQWILVGSLVSCGRGGRLFMFSKSHRPKERRIWNVKFYFSVITVFFLSFSIYVSFRCVLKAQLISLFLDGAEVLSLSV